jgi:hypothetical protein
MSLDDPNSEEVFEGWTNSWFELQAPVAADLGEVHLHDEMTLFNLRWKRFISWDAQKGNGSYGRVHRGIGPANSGADGDGDGDVEGEGETSNESKRTLLDASLEWRLIEVIPFNDGSELHEDIIYGGTVVRLMHLGTLGTLYCDESHLTSGMDQSRPKKNLRLVSTGNMATKHNASHPTAPYPTAPCHISPPHTTPHHRWVDMIGL